VRSQCRKDDEIYRKRLFGKVKNLKEIDLHKTGPMRVKKEKIKEPGENWEDTFEKISVFKVNIETVWPIFKLSL